MGKKIFIPEKYGMKTCPSCKRPGFIQNPKRQPCTKCGGFGFIKKESEQNTTIFTGNK
jgi:DnaJ-class molecular chaperone